MLSKLYSEGRLDENANIASPGLNEEVVGYSNAAVQSPSNVPELFGDLKQKVEERGEAGAVVRCLLTEDHKGTLTPWPQYRNRLFRPSNHRLYIVYGVRCARVEIGGFEFFCFFCLISNELCTR